MDTVSARFLIKWFFIVFDKIVKKEIRCYDYRDWKMRKVALKS